MENRVIQAKIALGIACAIAGAVLYVLPQPRRLSDRGFARGALALQIISRLGIFLLLFVVLRQKVVSDVPEFYVPQGHFVRAGMIPYRNFLSSYGPAFPYLIAAIQWFWDSAKAIVLVAIACETMALGLWLRFGFRVHGSAATRAAAILYVCGATPMIISAVTGQNQLWMALTLAAACALIARRDALSGAWIGLSAVAVKILAAALVPPLILFSRRPLRWLGAFAVVLLIGYGGIWFLGANPTTPIWAEADKISSGNLPFLLTAARIPDSRFIGIIDLGLLALIYAFIFWRCWKRGIRRDLSRLAPAIAFMLLAFLILSRKSFTNYLAIFYFPLCLSFAGSRKMNWLGMLLFGVGGAIAAVEPSAWFRLAGQTDLSPFSRGAFSPALAAFFAIELALLASYAILAGLSYRLVFAPDISSATRSGAPDIRG